MTDDREVLLTAAELLESGEPFVMVTVVRAQGSTPRNPGARMIWRPHTAAAGGSPNGAHGTVGGGQFEHLVLDAARSCYDKRSHATEKYVLGADADQCCGGTMEVFFEYHGRPARVAVFGAGHVAHALAEMLSHSPVEVIVVDDREDWGSRDRYPRARCVHSWDEGVRLAHEHPASTLAVVMTCSHDTDFELLRKLLVRMPVFLGLIGSRSKRVCLFGRLVASGIDEGIVQQVHCPIGVGDTGKEPHAVAVSIAAQLLMEARKLARA
ncbi:MAG: xanthine dehydrogenase accessory protein XdhC [Phycisphaerales bacterium]|nr:xanthine dehydrogenase accessory protein XdhC [Phycisphaerales bacterium]